jgi:hypothetical protein
MDLRPAVIPPVAWLRRTSRQMDQKHPFPDHEAPPHEITLAVSPPGANLDRSADL